MSKKEKPSKNTNLERRDLIKGLATVPVAGVFLANLWRKMKRDAEKNGTRKATLSPKTQTTSPDHYAS